MDPTPTETPEARAAESAGTPPRDALAGATSRDAPTGGPAVAFTPRPFRSPWWLRGPHAQTVGGKVFRHEPPVPLERERITLADGDFVDLDIGPAPDGDGGSPVAVLLHGLEGSALRRYMRITYAELLRRGVRSVGLNFRSCSGEPNRGDRFYHSGETEDLAEVIALLKARHPGHPIAGIGFSLGGNVLLKYLGERGEEAGLGAAAAVSVPYDLAAGAEALERGLMSRVYNGYFLRMLRGKVRARGQSLVDRMDVPASLRARTLRQFDEAVTAPLHGFADAADYYARSSSGPFVEGIRVPTLLLHSFDDPFLPPESVPVTAAETNPWIVPAFADTGGHVGFIHGTPRRPRFWAEEEAARFVSHVIG